MSKKDIPFMYLELQVKGVVHGTKPDNRIDRVQLTNKMFMVCCELQ